MSGDDPKHGSFWGTVPGILTGVAAILTAATGLYLATRSPSPPPPVSPLPPPPPVNIVTTQHFTGPMGALEHGISYNGGDIYDRPAATPEACVQLCANDDRCRAVTFIISQNRCWVKDRVNASASSSDMISSRKQTS